MDQLSFIETTAPKDAPPWPGKPTRFPFVAHINGVPRQVLALGHVAGPDLVIRETEADLGAWLARVEREP